MMSPLVAIVIRTKNRPVLLKRALVSVLDQTYENWHVFLVNDGGELSSVDALVHHYAACWKGRISVIHNERSLGMEGASKVGLAQSFGDLIILHDDDDSWAPEFLSVTTSTLKRVRKEFPTVEGVATYSNRVWERIHGQTVQSILVESFNGWIPEGILSLDRVLASNIMPPISFLFTREMFVLLNEEYERIPYLGDWDFLVRFLAKRDIYMIPQFLAFYHWRAASDGTFGNSVTAEVYRHDLYRQLLLNEWLRADLTSGRFGIGAYANLRVHVERLMQQGNTLIESGSK